MGIKRLGLIGAEVQRHRKEQSLGWRFSAFKHAHELLIQHAFVRGMLIDENDAVIMLKQEVHPTQL